MNLVKNMFCDFWSIIYNKLLSNREVEFLCNTALVKVCGYPRSLYLMVSVILSIDDESNRVTVSDCGVDTKTERDDR